MELCNRINCLSDRKHWEDRTSDNFIFQQSALIYKQSDCSMQYTVLSIHCFLLAEWCGHSFSFTAHSKTAFRFKQEKRRDLFKMLLQWLTKIQTFLNVTWWRKKAFKADINQGKLRSYSITMRGLAFPRDLWLCSIASCEGSESFSLHPWWPLSRQC